MRNVYKQMWGALQEFQQLVGDDLIWFEADAPASTTDQTYTEGPVPGIQFQDTYGEYTQAEPSNPNPAVGGNLWKAPITVPAIWIRYIDPQGTQTEEGSYLTSHITARISGDQMRRIGLGHPDDPFSHMNDRFVYKSKLYRVESYTPKGWLDGWYLMVDVAGIQLKPADLYTDPFPFWTAPTTPWGPRERMNWPAGTLTALD